MEPIQPLNESLPSPNRLRNRRSPTPPESTPSELDVARLPTEQYEAIIKLVEEQIKKVVEQALFLQSRGCLIERIVFIESIVYLITTSVSTLLGAADISQSVKKVAMYVFFAMGVIFSCFGLWIKHLKQKQDKDIDAYRAVLLDLIHHYEQDAWLAIERERMALPAHVSAKGFFRGLSNYKK